MFTGSLVGGKDLCYPRDKSPVWALATEGKKGNFAAERKQFSDFFELNDRQARYSNKSL